MRSVFNNSTFSKSLKHLAIRNSKKKKIITAKIVPTFDIKEIESVGGLLKNLSHFSLEGITVTDNMLKCFFSGFRALKSLSLRNCHGFTNHVFLWICVLMTQLEELEISGGPHEYLRAITYEGLRVFEKNEMKIKKLSLNYCAKVGELCLQIVSNCFKYH